MISSPVLQDSGDHDAAGLLERAPFASAEFQAPESNEVGSLARRGAGWSAATMFAKQAVSLGSTAILARLLTASDYGLLAMVLTFSALVQVFADFGLSWATVQKKDITRAQIDYLFLVNTAVGLLLWGACAASGPLLARFYRQPQLVGIAVVLGASFLFSGIAVQPLAIMRRRMLYKRLSFIEASASIAATVAGVIAAFAQMHYWALVIVTVAQPFFYATLLLIYGGYRPRLPKNRIGVRALLSFGGYVAAYNLLNYFSRNLDNVLVGKVWGAELLGYYSRAYFLMTLPTMLASSMLGAVMVPALAALREDKERMAAAYRRAVRLIAFVSAPLMIGLAVTAPEFVRIVYGAKWMAVVPILWWLSIAGVLQPVQSTAGWLFLVNARVREMLIVGIIVSCGTVLAFSASISFGVITLAKAYALVNCLCAIPVLWYAHAKADISFAETVSQLKPTFVATAAMGVTVFALRRGLHTLPLTLLALAEVSAGVLIYALGIRLLDQGMWDAVLQRAPWGRRA